MHPCKYLRSCPHYFVSTQLLTIMLSNLCDKLPGKLPGSMCMVIKIRKASIEFCKSSRPSYCYSLIMYPPPKTTHRLTVRGSFTVILTISTS